ncbi:hypothetical protein [Psychromonas sp. SP041]|uniref:hypothetical protein n=1 Tax=Psychromonas sp. SP041 TaxID=1365007 RepID=UPI00040EC6C0|nr:hypothetical protein [Psychromonas sp. SP041]
MKIVVIGTSNSVMGGNGFIKALMLDHEVIQLSSGRVPFFYHIKTIENNKALIESSDLLLIDHYINDVNFYSEALGEEYNQLCEDFYYLLSSINTRIINVLFPIRDLKKRDTITYYEQIKKSSRLYSLCVLDLNETPFSRHHFSDNIHITHDASYALGIVLGKELLDSDIGQKPQQGYCRNMPFKVINIEDLPLKNNNAIKTFSNSLMRLKYLDVKDTFLLQNSSTAKLLSVGYLRVKNKEGHSGIMINGHKFSLSGYGYFHETIDIDLFGDLEVSPVLSNDLTLSNLMGRGLAKGVFSYCYLTEFFLYDKNSPFQIQSASRTPFIISLPKLIDVVDRICSIKGSFQFPALEEKTINLLREMAIKNEGDNLKVAFDLMNLANLARPKGPVIKSKLEEYRFKLNKEIESESELKKSTI